MMFVDGRPLRVLRKSTRYDLCLVQPLRQAGGLLVATKAPRPYDDVYTLGHPAGIPLQYFEGHYTGKFNAEGVEADAYSFPAAGGQSGSPVLDTHGYIVGLIAWRFQPTGQALAVKWVHLVEFLRQK
jgi:hypothetical protein